VRVINLKVMKVEKEINQMKKFLNKVTAIAICAIMLLGVTPAFAAEVNEFGQDLQIIDGVDIGESGVYSDRNSFEGYLAEKRSRFGNNSQWYHSPSFSNNVQIGNGQVFSTGTGGITFIRPAQRNLNEPWFSVSITYQAIVASTGAVMQGVNRVGGGQVADVGLYNARLGAYRLNLANISRVPAMAEGTVSW
jgi:hypothetical protein